MLFLYLLDIPNARFPTSLSTQILYAYVVFCILTTCSTCPVLLGLIVRTAQGDLQEPRITSLRNVQNYSVRFLSERFMVSYVRCPQASRFQNRDKL
jgi:hypothetical protein